MSTRSTPIDALKAKAAQFTQDVQAGATPNTDTSKVALQQIVQQTPREARYNQSQSAPSFAQHMNDKAPPCPDAVTTLDMAKCFSNAKDAADSELNSVYQRIREKLETDDMKRLTAAQRFWIQYRDANCSAERSLYGGGTAAGPVYLACLEAMTRARTTELRLTYAVRLK
jgi:uncharacterized protein YecT (DUF1311 family)